MQNDNFHKYALVRLAEGIRKATEMVAPTMGAAGTNVVIQSTLNPGHLLTNDGATIIKSIELADTIENLGLTFIKEAVERSNNNSGDGSTTTSVLLNAILQEGIKSGVSTLEIKQSLDECLPLIEKSLDEQTRKITIKDVKSVAFIAGESEELAQTLSEIYTEIGSEGIIHLEGSGTYTTTFSIIDGVRFPGTGYLSPYMGYNQDTEKSDKKALYHKPKILVTKKKIEKIQDIEPLLSALIARNEKSLVIFTDDMDSNVARAMIELQKSETRSINILIIKAPVLWKNYVFEDFAKVVGATIIEDAAGTSLGTKMNLDWLGTCETLLCDKEETTVIGIADIQGHLKDIKDDESLPSDDKAIRLSYLKTKTAILKLGAKSETELSYIRLKCEDAIHSCRLALQGGIVAGGGIALLNTSIGLPDTVGGTILKQALKAPAFQIVTNAGKDISLFKIDESNNGFNAKTGEIVDMFDAGIVDAALIVKGAIRNALGIASTLLTTSSVITLPVETKKQDVFPF